MKALNNKKIKALLIFTIFLNCSKSALSEGWERDWNWNADVTYNNVAGKSSSSSFLTEKTKVNQLLSLVTEKRSVDKLTRIVSDFSIATDKRIEPDRVSLKNFTYIYKSKDREIQLGDTMGSLTPYTLSRSIKGINYSSEDPQQGLKFTAVLGMATSQWGYIFSKNNKEQKNIYVGGIGVEKDLSGIFTVGLNYSYTDENNVVENAVPTSVNRVISYKIKAQPASVIGLDWEYANSKTNSNKGAANNLKLNLKGGPVKLKLGYEVTEADFSTLSGSSTSDRKKLNAKLNIKLAKGLRAAISNTSYRNNLDEDSTVNTKYSNTTHFKISKKGLLGRRRLTVRFKRKYRDNNKKNSDSNVVNTGYGLSDRLGKYKVNINYDRRYFDDKSTGNNDRFSGIVAINTSSEFRPKDFIILRPSFEYTYTLNDDIKNDSKDKISSIVLNVSGNIHDDLVVTAGYNFNGINRPASNDQQKNNFSLEVMYSLDKDMSLSMGYSLNNNTADDPSLEYKEDMFNFSFEKKF